MLKKLSMREGFFFSVRLLSVLRGHSVFHPRNNGQWPPTSMDFYTRSYPLHYCLILILEKEPVFPFFQFWVLNKGTAGTIFITSLVWRGPWLGIEPGAPALEASTLPLGYRGGGFEQDSSCYAGMQVLANYRCKLTNRRTCSSWINKSLNKSVLFWLCF